MRIVAQYTREYRRCGKPNCRRCTEGPGHGPYWYASWREDGRLKTRYVGKELPSTPTDTPGPRILEYGRVPQRHGTAAQEESEPPEAARHALPPAGLRIWLLGHFHVECQGRQIAEWRRVSAATLLKLLALAH